MRAVVVEDNTIVRQEIIELLSLARPDLEIVGEAASVVEAAKVIASASPDLLFLDIELPDGTGFDLLDILTDVPAVIFITASEEYALKAFRVSAIDYLLKPVDRDELGRAIDRVVLKGKVQKEQLELARTAMTVKKAPSTLALHTSDRIHFLDCDEIIRCESDGNYTNFFSADGQKILVARTLKEYDAILSPAGFIRVHQSHLVNPKYIREFVKVDGGYLVLKDGAKVPVSTRKRAAIIDFLDSRI